MFLGKAQLQESTQESAYFNYLIRPTYLSALLKVLLNLSLAQKSEEFVLITQLFCKPKLSTDCT